jgi:hypothetical protein
MINFSYINNSTNTIKINPITRPVLDFHSEVISTAKFIKDHSNKKIMVALSGGIDGEVACLGFLKSKIDFEVLTIEYTDKKNSYDCFFAKKFCENNNIKQHILTVDPEKFYTDIISKYQSQNIYVHSIYRYLQIYLLDTMNQMGFLGICGAGEQLFDATDDDILKVKYEPLHIPENWLNTNNILGFPSFYLANPEIQAAYYAEPLIKFLLSDPSYFKNQETPKQYRNPRVLLTPKGFSSEKILVYHKHFDMVRRRKMIGFEDFLPLKIKLEEPLKQFIDNSKYFYKDVAEVYQELAIY